MTKSKEVDGLAFVETKKGFRTHSVKLVLRVTKDKYGQSLSLADERNGLMLEIPLEPVSDLIEVKE